MWERDRFLNGNILICRRLFVSLSLNLVELDLANYSCYFAR